MGFGTTLVGSSTTAAISAGSITLTKNASTGSTDLMVAFVSVDGNGTSVTNLSTSTSGWTQRAFTNNGTGAAVAVFTAAGSAANIVITPTGGGSTSVMKGQILTFPGGDTTNPFGTTPNILTGTGATSSVGYPSVTSGVRGSIMIRLVASATTTAFSNIDFRERVITNANSGGTTALNHEQLITIDEGWAEGVNAQTGRTSTTAAAATWAYAVGWIQPATADEAGILQSTRYISNGSSVTSGSVAFSANLSSNSSILIAASAWSTATSATVGGVSCQSDVSNAPASRAGCGIKSLHNHSQAGTAPTVVVTRTSGSDALSFVALEVIGIDQSNPIGATATGTGDTTSTTYSATTGTTTSGNKWVFFAMGAENSPSITNYQNERVHHFYTGAASFQTPLIAADDIVAGGSTITASLTGASVQYTTGVAAYNTSTGATTLTRNAGASAAIVATNTRTAGASAAIQATATRNAGTSAAIQQPGIQRTAGASAAIKATNTRQALASAAILATNTRQASTSAAIKAFGVTRTAGASGAIQVLGLQRTAGASAAIQQPGIQRSASAAAVILATNTRAAGAGAVILATNTRSAGTSAAILATNTRQASASAALAGSASTRQALASAAISALLIKDTFTDANGTPIGSSTTAIDHVADSGHTWILMGGGTTPTISGNALVANGTANTNIKIKTPTSDPIITMTANVGADTATRANGILFRYKDANNYWLLRQVRNTTGSTARLELYNRNAGTLSGVLASGGTVAANTNHVVQLVASGQQIIAYLDGTQALSYTDSSSFLIGERYVGIRFDGGGDPTGRAILDYQVEGPAAPSQWFWSCDFEGEGSIPAGSTTQWTVDGSGAFANSGTGTQTETIVASPVHGGSNALKLSVTGIGALGSGEQGARAFFDDPPKTAYIRTFLYIPQSVTVGSGFWNIWQIKSVPYVGATPFSSSQVSWGLYLANRAGSGNMYLLLRDKTGDYATLDVNDEAQTVDYTQSVKDLPVNQWIELEIYVKARKDGTGEITVWQDGTILWSFTGVKTANSYDQYQSSVNVYAGATSPTSIDMVVDDVVVSNAPIGNRTTSTRQAAASAAISVVGTRQASASAAVRATNTRTAGTSAAVLATNTRQAGASATISGSLARQAGASAAIIATNTRQAGASAALLATNTRSTLASAAILATNNKQAGASAALLATTNRQAGASANISTSSLTRQAGASAALITPALTRQAGASAAIQTLGNTRQATTSAAILATNTRQAAASAALLATNTRQAAASANISGSLVRQAGASAAIKQNGVQRTALASAALITPALQRQAGASAALVATNTRQAGASAAILGPATRQAGASAAIKQNGLQRTAGTSAAIITPGLQRTAQATAAIQTAITRQAQASAALLATNTRTAGASATISGSLVRQAAASAAIIATGTRQVNTSAALQTTLVRLAGAAAAISQLYQRQAQATATIVGQGQRSYGASASFLVVGGYTDFRACIALSYVQALSESMAIIGLEVEDHATVDVLTEAVGIISIEEGEYDDLR